MKKEAHSLIFLYFILQLCVLVDLQKVSHYSIKQGLSPGQVYDLGNISPTDIIKINLSWVLITNFGGSPIITFYKVIGNITAEYPNPNLILNISTLNNLVQQVTFGQQAQFYVGLKFSQGQGVTYEIEILKNSNQLIFDKGVVVSDYNVPIYRFKMPYKCKMRIKIKLQANPIFVVIFTKTIPVYTGNQKEFDFSFPEPGTYAIFIYPNQTKQIPLPINILTPYSITLQSYCDNYCGEILPIECKTADQSMLNNINKIAYSLQKGSPVIVSNSIEIDKNPVKTMTKPIKSVTYQIKNMRKRN